VTLHSFDRHLCSLGLFFSSLRLKKTLSKQGEGSLPSPLNHHRMRSCRGFFPCPLSRHPLNQLESLHSLAPFTVTFFQLFPFFSLRFFGGSDFPLFSSINVGHARSKARVPKFLSGRSCPSWFRDAERGLSRNLLPSDFLFFPCL